LSNKLVGRTDIACDCWQPMPQRHSWAEPLENATGDSIKSILAVHHMMFARIGTSAVVLILALVAKITLEVSRSGY